MSNIVKNIKVFGLNKAIKEEWDKKVCFCKKADYFSSTSFALVMKKTFGWQPFFVSLENKSFFLFFLKNIFFGPIQIKNAFSYSMPLAVSKEHKKKLVGTTISIAKANNCFSFSFHDSEKLKNWFNEKRAEIIVKTSMPEKKIFSGFSKNLRKNIKRCTKKGVKILNGNSSDLKEFYGYYLEHHLKLGLPVYPFKYFEELFKEFEKTGFGRFFVAKKGRENVSCLMVSYFGGRAYELFVSNNPVFLGLYAQDLLKWHAIRFAAKNKFKKISLSEIDLKAKPGSKTFNVNKYKQKFGEKKIFFKNSLDLNIFAKIFFVVKKKLERVP